MTGYPRGLSADGSIVVGTTAQSADYVSSFRWATNSMSAPFADIAEALGISGDGFTIVGLRHESDARPHPVRAMWWTANLGAAEVPLGDLRGATNSSESSATSINFDGTAIAGTSNAVQSGAGAWVWTKADGARLVSAILYEYAVELGEASLNTVVKISSDGMTILGRDYSGLTWVARVGAN